MSRVIKFRAWDTEKNQFVLQGEIVFSNYGDTMIEVVPNDTSYIGDSCHNGEPQRGRFIVTQFTGLHDKNGKDIYEGDVFCVAGNIEWVVVFVGEPKEFSDEALMGGFGLSHQQRDLIIPFDTYSLQAGEVIGNIYENPELLQEKGGEG